MLVLTPKNREGSLGAAAAIRRTLKLKRPLTGVNLETAGIWPDQDGIVEIVTLKLYPDGKRTRHHARVNPGIRIPREAILPLATRTEIPE